jgi:hypothetical protein
MKKTFKSKNSWHCPFNMYSMFITEYDEIGWKDRNVDESQTYGHLTFMGLSHSKENKFIEYSIYRRPSRGSKKKRHTVFCCRLIRPPFLLAQPLFT